MYDIIIKQYFQTGDNTMKLSDLIAELQETLNINGDMDVVGITDGIIYPYIEINCPDSESPAYIEFYKD